MNNARFHPALTALYTVIGLLSAVWFTLALNTSINTDIVYLTQSAIYMLSGDKMSQAFYDNNPPLCMIIYLIPAFFIHALNTPFYETGLIYSVLLIFMTSYAIFSLLKLFPEITIPERHLITVIFFITNTITANLYISEKDQYIILGLFPFILLQLSSCGDDKISRYLKYYVLITGTIFMMVKPHFMIIPALVVLHRVIKKRNIRPVFMPDVFAMITGVLIYSILLLTCFHDYITIILPDALTLYTSVKNQDIINLSLLLFFILSILLFCCYFLPKKPAHLPCLFLLLSILCVIPYGIQGKGFYYHLLPAISFFTCGGTCALYRALIHSRIQFNEYTKYCAVLLICLTLYSLSYALFYASPTVLTHTEYKNSPLTGVLNRCEKQNCSYFMFNDTTEITQQLSVYSDQPHASRFASFWFLPPLLTSESSLPENEKNRLKQKYARMVVEDFKKFKPDTLILGKFFIEKNSPKPFIFINFFSDNSPEFKNEIQNYVFRETIPINIAEYFPGTLVKDNIVQFDIYERITDKNQE